MDDPVEMIGVIGLGRAGEGGGKRPLILLLHRSHAQL